MLVMATGAFEKAGEIARDRVGGRARTVSLDRCEVSMKSSTSSCSSSVSCSAIGGGPSEAGRELPRRGEGGGYVLHDGTC
jgi:hypothetical protein